MTSELSTPLACPSCGHLHSNSQAEFCQSCRFPLVFIAEKYRLESLLNEGGSSHVYLAKHIRLDRNAERVIKIIKGDLLKRDPSMAKRFYREVQMTADLSLRCQHVVRVFDDFGEAPKLGHYYVMEYLKGVSLAEHIKEQTSPLPLSQILHIFKQLCDVMNMAHQADIVHRDLKPDNMMLIAFEDDPHYLKVLDFGIAKSFAEEHAQNAKFTQGTIGTPIYMAPEHFLGGVVDFRADLYSMGIILFELLTGQAPFLRKNQHQSAMIEMMDYHLKCPPPSVHEFRKDIPKELAEIVKKSLEKKPEERFQSAKEFKQALLSVPVLPSGALPNSTQKKESKLGNIAAPLPSSVSTRPLVPASLSKTVEHSYEKDPVRMLPFDGLETPTPKLSLRPDNAILEGAQFTIDPQAEPLTLDDISQDLPEMGLRQENSTLEGAQFTIDPQVEPLTLDDISQDPPKLNLRSESAKLEGAQFTLDPSAEPLTFDDIEDEYSLSLSVDSIPLIETNEWSTSTNDSITAEDEILDIPASFLLDKKDMVQSETLGGESPFDTAIQANPFLNSEFSSKDTNATESFSEQTKSKTESFFEPLELEDEATRDFKPKQTDAISETKEPRNPTEIFAPLPSLETVATELPEAPKEEKKPETLDFAMVSLEISESSEENDAELIVQDTLVGAESLLGSENLPQPIDEFVEIEEDLEPSDPPKEASGSLKKDKKLSETAYYTNIIEQIEEHKRPETLAFSPEEKPVKTPSCESTGEYEKLKKDEPASPFGATEEYKKPNDIKELHRPMDPTPVPPSSSNLGTSVEDKTEEKDLKELIGAELYHEAVPNFPDVSFPPSKTSDSDEAPLATDPFETPVATDPFQSSPLQSDPFRQHSEESSSVTNPSGPLSLEKTPDDPFFSDEFSPKPLPDARRKPGAEQESAGDQTPFLMMMIAGGLLLLLAGYMIL